jgi:3-dehydroquinate dehydratase/shikimate dehydrogenase
MQTGSYLCTPITEPSSDNFLHAMQAADRVAEAIELRLDYLPAEDLPGFLATLEQRGAAFTKPLLFTFRPAEQGGRRAVTLAERRAFWQGLSPAIVEQIAYADFEYDLVESFHAETPPVPWEKVICSWHDFESTPSDLMPRYERMAATPAAIVKIATKAQTISDCLPLFDCLDRARGAKPVIALGMGMPGLMTRVLSLSRGAMLTFGSLARGAESAPGQPTIAELQDLYRIKQLSRQTEIFGIIGNPVSHSRSPRIHNTALAALGRDGVYLPFEVADIDRFAREFLRPETRRIDWRLRGLSVTIPHKRSILPYLDSIDETARVIGAINTVVVEAGKVRACNTDVGGAMKPLEALLDLKSARVAVLGAGGSARAICYGLKMRGAAIDLYARDLQRAQPLAEEFGTRLHSIENFRGAVDLVINCTPVGMHGHSEGESPIPAESLRGVRLVYDLIYAPEETALLREAKAAGCQTLGGLAMLVAQAGEQFRFWTGHEPPLDVMWQAARM